MRLLRKRRPSQIGKTSYAQSGEDLIIDFIFSYRLNNPTPTYLDLGAHHPTYLSNTYFFYSKGSSGVCVEADPALFTEIAHKRKRDICLNVGVGVEKGQSSFYIMSTPALNTFSRAEAERYESYGNQKIESVVELPVLTINDIIAKHFPSCPDFISLDVEGLDLQILRSFDFERYRPAVFCVETLTYTEDNSEQKLAEIPELMTRHNYFAYADTYINTIFVERTDWDKGGLKNS